MDGARKERPPRATDDAMRGMAWTERRQFAAAVRASAHGRALSVSAQLARWQGSTTSRSALMKPGQRRPDHADAGRVTPNGRSSIRIRSPGLQRTSEDSCARPAAPHSSGIGSVQLRRRRGQAKGPPAILHDAAGNQRRDDGARIVTGDITNVQRDVERMARSLQWRGK